MRARFALALSVIDELQHYANEALSRSNKNMFRLNIHGQPSRRVFRACVTLCSLRVILGVHKLTGGCVSRRVDLVRVECV